MLKLSSSSRKLFPTQHNDDTISYMKSKQKKPPLEGSVTETGAVSKLVLETLALVPFTCCQVTYKNSLYCRHPQTRGCVIKPTSSRTTAGSVAISIVQMLVLQEVATSLRSSQRRFPGFLWSGIIITTQLASSGISPVGCIMVVVLALVLFQFILKNLT